MIDDAWQYVAAAYGVAYLSLTLYGVSLYRRAHLAARLASEAQP